jgi:hypothetical protein
MYDKSYKQTFKSTGKMYSTSINGALILKVMNYIKIYFLIVDFFEITWKEICM